jgi:O-antigen/teichoic acid export membrane protein
MILIGVTLIQRSVGFGRGVLFCRWLSPDTLGQWEMTYSFLLLAAPLAVLGVPGSFGRYLEHFRQRGHLRTFLRRTTLWTTVCAVLAVATVIGCAPSFSYLLFRDYDNVGLMTTLLQRQRHKYSDRLWGGLCSRIAGYRPLGLASPSRHRSTAEQVTTA